MYPRIMTGASHLPTSCLHGSCPVIRGLLILLFLAGCLPATQAGFIRGPWIQNVTTNSIQIIWSTSEPVLSRIEYGATKDLGRIITEESLSTNHVVTLTALLPATPYYYRVQAISRDGQIETSSLDNFSTLKTSGSINFIVISDTARGGYLNPAPPQPLLAGVISRLKPDLVVHCGDLVSSDLKLNIQSQFFDFFQPAIRHVPFFNLAGNHDLFFYTTNYFRLSDPQAMEFQETFYLPTNSVDGSERFYSFDHGDVHFTCLFNPWFADYVFSTGSPQYHWLTNDLAATRKPWKLIFLHAGIATASAHSLDDYNYNGILDQTEIMNLILPAASRYGVQMVFSGHDHALQRFAPTNGVHHCVLGSGGQSLYPFVKPQPALAKFWPVHSCLRVGVTNDTMTLEAFDANQVRFDAWTIQKALSTAPLHQAAWHAPAMAGRVPENGDRNRKGQVFDFIGRPILPRAGEFSNLGRVYVNHDSVHLYIGFEQVMLNPSHALFLFIESPRQTGVSSMAELGNGKPDPAGQGVDGLDFLENLSFTNFAPSIGCILGDEYADGQFRGFVRTNLIEGASFSLARSLRQWFSSNPDADYMGQGVFRLSPGLPDVSGARLQQFDLSPQADTPAIAPESLRYDRNADFIQVSIPLRQLGDLKPGDTIQMGAVVGGEVDASTQKRWMDRSVLGRSLLGSGLGNVVLEGLRVQLSPPPETTDTDGDQMPDWQERLAGTDPRDPRSLIQVTASPSPSGSIHFTWQAVPGKKYHLEYADDLQDPFSTINDAQLPVTAVSSNETYTLNPQADSPAPYRFFRIRQMELPERQGIP